MQLLAAVTLEVPTHWMRSLKSLVAEYPTLKVMTQGWVIRQVVIYGPSSDIAALSVHLKEWERREGEMDAW
jgi:hypothetical protein